MTRLFLALLLLVSAARADTIAVDNASWAAGRSPFNWEVSGSTYIRAINPGAYFKLNFTGTSFAVTVDVSAMVSASVPAGQYPRLGYAVDGAALTIYQLLSSDTSVTLATGLADTTHSIICYLYSSDAYTNRWDGTMSLKITSATVGSGKTVTTARLRQGGKAIPYGDSITEGAWSLLTPNGPSYSNYSVGESAVASYGKRLADYFDCEYGQCAFGGQGWDAGFGDVPSLPNAWNLIKSGVSRDFTGVTLVTINMGTNGGVGSASTVTTFLTNLRAAIGTQAQIYLIIPFNQTGVTNITSGYNTYIAGAPGDKTYLIDLGSTGVNIVNANSTDAGIHPTPAGDAQEAAIIIPQMTYGLRPGQPNGAGRFAP